MSEPLRGTYDPVTGRFQRFEEPEIPETDADGPAPSEGPFTETPLFGGGREEPEIEPEEEQDELPEELFVEEEELLPEEPAKEQEKEEPFAPEGEEAPGETGEEPGEGIRNEDVKAILYGIEMLHKKFDLKVQSAEGQETLTKTMYAELQEYKKGLYASIMKPLLLEMIQLRENMLKQGTPLLDKDGPDAAMRVSTFMDYAEDIADVLEMYDVEVYRSVPGSAFDPRTQKILKKETTSCEEQNRCVAKSFSNGYLYDGHVVMKENVAVYVYVPENQESGETAANESEG